MKSFNVEILGREVAIYGGPDGHEVGTKVIGHRICDIMELDGNFTLKIRSSNSSRRSKVVVCGDEFVVEPVTGNLAITVGFDVCDVIRCITGVNSIHDVPFDEYCRMVGDLDFKGVSLVEFKEILKKLS